MSEPNKQSTPASVWHNARQFNTEFSKRNSGTYIYKIDRQNILQDYRSLRQKQRQFLAKINMSVEMKRELFGFPDSYYCQNTQAAEKLVVQNNPFKGKLVIDQKKWYQNEQKRLNQKKDNKKHNNQYAQLDIELEKNSQKLLSDEALIAEQKSINVEKLLGRIMNQDQVNGKSISSIEPLSKENVVQLLFKEK